MRNSTVAACSLLAGVLGFVAFRAADFPVEHEAENSVRKNPNYGLPSGPFDDPNAPLKEPFYKTAHLTAVRSNPDPEVKEKAALHFIGRVNEVPDDQLVYLGKLIEAMPDPSEEVLAAFHQSLHSLASADPEKTLRWAEALPDSYGRTEIAAKIASSRKVAEEQPEILFAHLDRTGWDFEPDAYSSAIIDATESLVERGDQAEAFLQISKIPDLEDASFQFVFVAARWAESDPTAAFSILNNLPDNSHQSTIIHYFIKILLDRDPEAAAEGFAALDNPQIRKLAGLEMLEFFSKSNPEALAAWWETLTPGDLREIVGQRIEIPQR